MNNQFFLLLLKKYLVFVPLLLIQFPLWFGETGWLDVWEKEPPSSDHKLLKLENVVATPHMAGVTVESRKQMSEFAAKQLLNIMKGGNPERPVNKDILPLFQSKLSQIIQYK